MFVASSIGANDCAQLYLAENKLANVSIYPNPSNHQVQIVGSSFPVNVTLRNMNGQLLGEFLIESKDGSIDVSNLQPGIYFIAIKNEGPSAAEVLKFIKK